MKQLGPDQAIQMLNENFGFELLFHCRTIELYFFDKKSKEKRYKLATHELSPSEAASIIFSTGDYTK